MRSAIRIAHGLLLGCFQLIDPVFQRDDALAEFTCVRFSTTETDSQFRDRLFDIIFHGARSLLEILDIRRSATHRRRRVSLADNARCFGASPDHVRSGTASDLRNSPWRIVFEDMLMRKDHQTIPAPARACSEELVRRLQKLVFAARAHQFGP
jgi:hypothetical protein